MKQEKIKAIGFSLLVAFGFLLICSRSSFLYPFNNWDDANSYFSMGKVMMNGGIIYRDSFDQKGPLLYFIYGIGYLLSHTTFFGVFLLEILFMAAFLMAGYEIARLYVRHKTAMILLPFIAMALTVSKSFYWGGSAEEFCLPFLAWGLYVSIRYFKEEYPENMDGKLVVICGLLAGCVMMIKYTELGFYFAWMAMVALLNLNKKNWKGSLVNCGLFLAGMIVMTIPWLVYFGINGALDDWYQCYVYCNVFLYSDFYVEPVSFGEKIYNLAKILYWLIWDDFTYFVPIIFGFIVILFTRKMHWYEKINLYCLFGFLFLGIYIGGTTLYYYPLPLAIMAIPGFVILGKAGEHLADEFYIDKIAIGMKVLVTVVVIGVLFGTTWSLSMNTEYAGTKKEDLFLYEFRDIVLQEENPTLLNISCLDAGLYTLADIVPNCRYFQSNAVHGFDEVGAEQLKYIREGSIDFVLAREFYPEEIHMNYELVLERPYTIGGKELIYYLFRKK